MQDQAGHSQSRARRDGWGGLRTHRHAARSLESGDLPAEMLNIVHNDPSSTSPAAAATWRPTSPVPPTTAILEPAPAAGVGTVHLPLLSSLPGVIPIGKPSAERRKAYSGRAWLPPSVATKTRHTGGQRELEPPGTTSTNPGQSQPEPTHKDSQDQCSGHGIPPAVQGGLISQRGHDLGLDSKPWLWQCSPAGGSADHPRPRAQHGRRDRSH
jgi:hypothetical protein